MLELSDLFHSPLAGGFLTGKVTSGNVIGTRFEEGKPNSAIATLKFNKPEMHAGIRRLEHKGKEHNLTMTEIGLRWVFYHSALQEDDGVILGASKPKYLEQNMAEIARGPLPDDVVEAIEGVWQSVKHFS